MEAVRGGLAYRRPAACIQSVMAASRMARKPKLMAENSPMNRPVCPLTCFVYSRKSGFGGAPFAGSMRTDGAQEMTVISKNTMIDGNIRSFADMKIDGNIKGNVETTKNININGKVVGDLTCDNISMKNSAVQGNVRLKGQAVMANDSMLIGDLTSQVAQLNGKIKGNIEISGKIQLDRDSVIIGDIKAGSIAISDGAVINGFVTTTYLSKDESANIFPESIALGE